MKKFNMTSLTHLLLAAACGFGFVANQAHAQAYPNKPIKAVVPFAAGSATDQIGRAFAQKMSEVLGQPIVVENKAGVNGMLGADAVAKSAPDGYTLLIGTNSTNAALKSLMKNCLTTKTLRLRQWPTWARSPSLWRSTAKYQPKP